MSAQQKLVTFVGAHGTVTITLEKRIEQLEAIRAHYAEKEQAFSCSSTSGPYGRGLYSNPWTGLRRATERVLDRLRGELDR